MNKISLLSLLLLLTMFLSGCVNDKAEKERIKWRLNLEKDSKLPYGTYLAFNSLTYYFPESKVEPLPRSFRYTSIDNHMKYNYDGHSLLILHGLDFYISTEEWKDLKQFIAQGNEVILFCSKLDIKIEKELQCFKERSEEEDIMFLNPNNESVNHHVLSIADDTTGMYGYNGRSLHGYFSMQADSIANIMDTTTDSLVGLPDTLGYAGAQPDFVRYSLGDGHLTLHAAPLVLSNYFLLQDNNKYYLDAVWHTLPYNINHIYWNDYYKRRVESAGLALLLKYPATRLALLLALFAMLLYVLFEGKRKQRIIPIIPPLRNDSVSFVETVGRLYYNKGDHSNLSQKMTLQFLEWVRTHYHLNTNLLNEDFVRQLTIKSGQPETTVSSLMELIHEIKMGTAFIDDAYLYQLYITIQLFYKNNRL